MPFDKPTLDAIRAAAPKPGGLLLTPEFTVPVEDATAVDVDYTALWLDTAGSTKAESSGATPAQALDNLLLVLQGRASEVSRAVLLARAQRREARIGDLPGGREVLRRARGSHPRGLHRAGQAKQHPGSGGLPLHGLHQVGHDSPAEQG